MIFLLLGCVILATGIAAIVWLARMTLEDEELALEEMKSRGYRHAPQLLLRLRSFYYTAKTPHNWRIFNLGGLRLLLEEIHRVTGRRAWHPLLAVVWVPVRLKIALRPGSHDLRPLIGYILFVVRRQQVLGD